jgi:hypothetical protein
MAMTGIQPSFGTTTTTTTTTMATIKASRGRFPLKTQTASQVLHKSIFLFTRAT